MKAIARVVLLSVVFLNGCMGGHVSIRLPEVHLPFHCGLGLFGGHFYLAFDLCDAFFEYDD